MRMTEQQFKNIRRSRQTATAKTGSHGECVLAAQLDMIGIEYEQEYKFHPQRKWRADFKIEGYPILIEVEGGTYSNGRHSRGTGFAKDCGKYNAAAKLGYFVIKGDTNQVKSGELLRDIQDMIEYLRAVA
ncbi:hypothetical protein [Acinetobacter puyangensis]|uniref:hypothetical protein n=1 Tax=Acinetobacter puyangensis TaxID=1096779 RepID=UPI003A4D1F80